MMDAVSRLFVRWIVVVEVLCTLGCAWLTYVISGP
jgi:hypothetical protein